MCIAYVGVLDELDLNECGFTGLTFNALFNSHSCRQAYTYLHLLEAKVLHKNDV